MFLHSLLNEVHFFIYQGKFEFDGTAVLCNLNIQYCVLVDSVVSDSLQSHGLQPARLLCPWDFPGKNTGVGCYFILQGIFPTQILNPLLLHWQEDSLPLRHLRSLVLGYLCRKTCLVNKKLKFLKVPIFVLLKSLLKPDVSTLTDVDNISILITSHGCHRLAKLSLCNVFFFSLSLGS